jgi:uncharacterized protein
MKQFSLLVKPASADCNLRCSYCFYLDRSGLYPRTATHRMSTEVLERMISSFMALPMPQCAFGWQGGEPTLMGVDFFREVTRLQQKHGRPGTIVANGLQTNGTLITDEFARHLAEYRFLLGVSLDGPEDVHDVYRRHADNRGSHAEVLKGIERLQTHGVEFNILVLVNDRNATQAARIYRYLCDQGFLHHQYIPCVEFNADGSLMPFSVTGEAWGRFLCELYDTWVVSDTRRVSIRLFDSTIAWLVNGTRTVCNMGTDCRQYFVVEHNGDIYPCDFFVERDLRLGNVMSMTWEQAQRAKRYREFGERKRQWNERCAQCRFLDLCAGDCPKHRLTGVSTPEHLSVLCDGWHAFYTHALPGLRTLADTVRAGMAAPAAAPSRPRVSAPAGRNDPCPCGSGRKYKQCCGRTQI